jgi:hypothetical protein
MGALQTADTVGEGRWRWSAQLMAQGVDPADNSPLGWGQAAVGVQYGLSDAVDVGGRVSTFGAELSGKVRLVKSEDSPWVVSLAPVVGAHQFVLRADAYPEYGEQRYAALPVLVGLDTGGGQWVLGVRPTWLYFPEAGNLPAESAFAVGGSLGYAFKLGSRVRLMPEVAAMVPVGPLPASSETRADGVRPHVQFGLAFMLDSGGGR